jgi:hypothetical protein
MARDLTNLLSDLRAFDPLKSASVSPETATDPTEAGTATAVPDTLHNPSGSNATLSTPPEAPTMPGGIEKSPQGSVTAPAPGPFVTNGKEAASFQAGIASMKSKLAAFGSPAPTSPQKSPQAYAAQTTAKQASEDATAGFGRYHLLIAANLMKSASGRELMNKALDEVIGVEDARALLKSAAAEQAEFEAGYLQEKIAAVEQYELDKQAAYERAVLAQEYRELTKSASAEDVEKINKSLFIMKKAEDLFAAHPEAHHAFLVGVQSANKFAAAMEEMPPGAEGMPPEAMAEMAPEAGAEMAPEGPPSPEELEAALMELVQAGAITEEQAIQLLEQILGGEGGGEMPPGAEGMPPGAEEMPPEEVAKAAAYADAHLDKVASVLFAE